MRYLLTLCAVMCTLSTARAQPTDATAAADVLFDEAKRLMERGEFEPACPKLEASLKLDATAIGTRVNLADCYERIGRLASAWSMYRSAADRARISHDPRESLATERAGRLEPRLPKLTILATGGPPNLSVTRAGVAVEAALFGTQVFVDPGKTVVIASAPGFERYEVTVEMAAGDIKQIEVPPLVPEKVAPGDTPPHTAPPPRVITKVRDRKRVWTGVAIAGAGLALAGGGLVLGITASSAWDDAFSSGACERDTHRCNAHGQELTDRARTRANLATVFVAGGAVAVGVGAYLVFAAPKHERQRQVSIAPAVSRDTIGLAVTGGF